MKITVVNHMRYDFQIHRFGCADVARQVKKREVNSHWDMDVEPGKDIAEAVALDVSAGFGWPETYEEGEEMPWRAEHMRVMPCCPRVAK